MDSLKKLVLMKYDIDLTNDIETLKVKLPFCCEEEGCKNLKYSAGLFTQCSKDTDDDFCKVCRSEINRTGAKYGTTNDRKKYKLGEFISNTGKMEVDYLKYMKQHGYTKEMVINAAKLREVELPENIFDKKKTLKIPQESTKRDVVVDDSESEKDSIIDQPVKRGRGRPRKEEKKLINQEDIETKKEKSTDSKKKSSPKPTQKPTVEDKPESKIKLVPESEPNPEPETVSEVEPKHVVEPEPESDKEIELENSDSDSDSEDEIEVRNFEFEGVTYLKDVNNSKIYTGDGEHIGFYNIKTKKIEFE